MPKLARHSADVGGPFVAAKSRAAEKVVRGVPMPIADGVALAWLPAAALAVTGIAAAAPPRTAQAAAATIIFRTLMTPASRRSLRHAESPD
jgi:hypothetical protein